MFRIIVKMRNTGLNRLVFVLVLLAEFKSFYSSTVKRDAEVQHKPVRAKYWTLTKYFNGYPKESDMEIREEELPPLKDGEFLAEAVYFSLDPCQRFYAVPGIVKLGDTFFASQMARIIESKNPKFQVGKYVNGDFGWRTHTISNGEAPYIVSLLSDYGSLPISLGLGMFGIPGMAAYFGLLEICQPKEGETLVVTAAAGAVGSLVGQIGKIKGLTVIGIAGSDKKGKWLRKELGFHHFINYKTENIEERLKKIAPQGVDCYFDSVGGEISSKVLQQMNEYGRIAVNGAMSIYNEVGKQKASIIQEDMVFKQLKMEGFMVHRWVDRFPEAVDQYLQWLKFGLIKYEETVTEGFDYSLKAFIGMLKGENRGKAVVKL